MNGMIDLAHGLVATALARMGRGEDHRVSDLLRAAMIVLAIESDARAAEQRAPTPDVVDKYAALAEKYAALSEKCVALLNGRPEKCA